MNNKKKTYLLYSLLFCFLFFFCFEIYLLWYHKSILWKEDTYQIHYLQFLYLGRWVRHVISSHQFPIWDPSIGYGADFYNSMPGVFCDPLNWIAVFFPEKYAEVGFHLLIVTRLWLCGLAFTWFGMKKGQPQYATLCGAIIYTFCSCAYTGLYQSIFLLPMYLLPPMLIGADELFEKKRSGLYVGTLSLCAVISFYITYMMAILIMGYILLKWICAKNIEKTVLPFARMVGRFLLYSFWSALIAMVSLYPMAKLMTGMNRLSLEHVIPPFYSKSFYAGLFRGFINSYNMMHRDAEIGFSVLALVCVLALFMMRNRNRGLIRTVFLIMTLGLAVPYIGHVMNGFSYVANRWIWAYAFVVAWICTLVIPELRNLSMKNNFAISFLCLVYILISLGICRAGRAFAYLSVVLLSVCAFLFLCNRLSDPRYRHAMIFLSCITVIIPAFFQYSAQYSDYFGDNLEAGTAYERALESKGMPLLNLVDTSDGTRFNSYGLPIIKNACWLYGISGMDYYLNLYNSDIDAFHSSVALHTGFNNFTYNGADRRSELLALLGVNHFFAEKDFSGFPLGFEETEAETIAGGTEIESRKPEKETSLFTRFSETLSLEDYEKLSAYERQQALLQACVLDNRKESSALKTLVLDGEEIPYQISFESGLSLTNSGVQVSDEGSGLILSFPAQQDEDGELYLCFDNLVYEYGDATAGSLKAEALWKKEKVNNDPQKLSIGTKAHHMYGGKHNWILNLGEISDSVDGIRIVFNNIGTYSFDAMRIYVRNRESALQNIERLNHDVSNVGISTNKFAVTVDNYEKEYLFASVPWDEGWSAYDNGMAIPIEKADIAFMAVELEPGHHEVVFQYHNTVIRMGLITSGLALAGYILFLWIERRRAQNKENGIENRG